MGRHERLRTLEALAGELLAGIRTLLREEGGSPAPAPDPDDDDAPTNGRLLFGFARDNNLLKEVAAYGKARNLPKKIIDWDDRDAQACYRSLARTHAS
jgi:hypothetical protein